MNPDVLRLVRIFAVGLQAFAAGGCVFLLWRLYRRSREGPSEAPWPIMIWAVTNLLLLLMINTTSRIQRIVLHSPIVWQDWAGVAVGVTCAGWVLYVARRSRMPMRDM